MPFQIRTRTRILGIVIELILVILICTGLWYMSSNNVYVYALLIISTMILCAISCIVVYMCKEWAEQWNGNRRETRRQMRLTNKIRRLDKQFNNSHMVKSQDNCTICLEELINGIELTCGHIFHKECLQEMITYAIFECPLCRMGIV